MYGSMGDTVTRRDKIGALGDCLCPSCLFSSVVAGVRVIPGNWSTWLVTTVLCVGATFHGPQ